MIYDVTTVDHSVDWTNAWWLHDIWYSEDDQCTYEDYCFWNGLGPIWLHRTIVPPIR